MKKAKRMRKGLKGSPMTHGSFGRMRIDGLPVRDAKEPLLLEVNKGDVLHSNRKDPGGCAAAVAAMRQEHTSKAYVYRTKTYIKRKDFFERYQNPDGLRIELGAFDKGVNSSRWSSNSMLYPQVADPRHNIVRMTQGRPLR